MTNLPRRWTLRSVPLSRAYTGRANSFGLLRLLCAFAVVLAHTAVLGYGQALSKVIDVPGMAVAGFFGISGFLITRSARRSSLPRYLWHRALRIWPALWVCLTFTALVVAPWAWYRSHGSFEGLWRSPTGAVNYVLHNFWGGHRQAGIGDVFRDSPYGHLAKRSVMNGSLWTLAYELFCYLIIAALAALAVLRRARWLCLIGAVAVFAVLCYNYAHSLSPSSPGVWTTGTFGPLPGLGTLMKVWFLRYGFMFLLGAVADLYSDRLPINDLLGTGALAITALSALSGQFFGPGLVAYEYLLLWLAVRLPATLHWVGQRNDYSYGIYIYSFLAQQSLAVVGLPSRGFITYLGGAALSSFGLAYLSWHLVEKQALKLKGWTPRLLVAWSPLNRSRQSGDPVP
jgi:peptidoglycan/LPS O-acetylase OafA/YrhL